MSSLINDNDAETTAYETRRCPRKQKTVTSNALIPVSYTHLDVYKRQEYDCRLLGGVRLACAFVSELL